ncbi:MAG: hypothetical protein P1Q69_20290 [Candidatus Thorarchaeota archaeon]|nr:hypothetical protein [Candidatus Thorarchaeota archaeon]
MAEEQIPAWPLYANTVFGILYLIVAILYTLSGFGLILPLPASDDVIGSLMLFIVSVVYLAGIKPLMRGLKDGYAFTLVATVLAAILFVLHLIVFATDALGWILGLENWLNWAPLGSLSPAIWLFGMILVGIAILRLTDRMGGEKGIFPIGG